MNVSAVPMSNYQATYLGAFDRDPTSPHGPLAGRLTGGSNLLEVRQPSRSLVLYGVLKAP